MRMIDANKYENLVSQLRESVRLADTDPSYGVQKSLILQAALAINTLLGELEQAKNSQLERERNETNNQSGGKDI